MCEGGFASQLIATAITASGLSSDFVKHICRFNPFLDGNVPPSITIQNGKKPQRLVLAQMSGSAAVQNESRSGSRPYCGLTKTVRGPIHILPVPIPSFGWFILVLCSDFSSVPTL